MKTKLSTITLLLVISHLLFAQRIDTKHLLLNLKFDWEKHQAIGMPEISCSPITASNKIHLDAAMLTIHSIKSKIAEL